MQDNKQRVFAFMFCLLLVVLYKQLVFDPYFLGPNGDGTTPEALLHPATQTTQSAVSAANGTGARPPVVSPAVQPTGQTPQAQPGIYGTAAASAVPTAADLHNAGTVEVSTDTLDLTISLLGGRVTQALLNRYRETLEPQSPRLNLVTVDPGNPLPLGVSSAGVNDALVQYTLISAPSDATTSTADGGGPQYNIQSGKQGTLVLQGALPDGREIRKSITFNGSGYLADVEVSIAPPAQAANGVTQPSPIELSWTRSIPEHSDVLNDTFHTNGFTVYDGKKAERLQFTKINAQHSAPPLPATWISMADKYFTVALISPESTALAMRLRNGTLFEERIAESSNPLKAKVFLGPKSISLLESSGYGLEHNIDFGWTAIIARPLSALLHFFFGVFGNYGLAIVTLTILVRSALFPVNQTAFKQMKKMQDIAPEVKKMRDTIKDKQQQQLEMMALYKKNGVNPLGGCLPMFVQLPIFIGLYSSLMVAVELRHAKFAFWINDLSAQEKLMLGDIGIPVMVLLFVASMFLQQYLSPAVGMEPAQRKMMLAMPVIFGFMFLNFPAGLTLYWLTNNIISIGQQQAMYNKRGISPLLVTALTSLAVFVIAFTLVKASGG